MPSAAAPLREAVKRQFYPFAEGRGFLREKVTNPLFVTFRRERNGEIQLFDIQWDKRHRPFFVLNFGKGTPEDNNLYPNAGRLQRRRGGAMRNWFNPARPWASRLRSGRWRFSPEEVAAELIDAFGELERWWVDGTAGPHVDLWGQADPVSSQET